MNRISSQTHLERLSCISPIWQDVIKRYHIRGRNQEVKRYSGEQKNRKEAVDESDTELEAINDEKERVACIGDDRAEELLLALLCWSRRSRSELSISR